ncbi:MAG: hypothetical protein JSW04_01280 [Desulfobacterales bacterium]|nr:MAG: hypothetical protein JSW04_01280 [Desulfobacterales bacterium]
MPLKKHDPAYPQIQRKRSGGIHFRATILAESLRHFKGLAVGSQLIENHGQEGSRFFMQGDIFFVLLIVTQ